MPKKDLKKTKAETVTVKGTITTMQKEAISSLVGILGSNEQDVVGKVITLWLYNEGFLKASSEKVQSRNSQEGLLKGGGKS